MAVFLYTAPIFSALGLHLLLPSERLRRLQWLGIALCFGGVVMAADSTPFGHSAHADPDTCSTIIRTGSRSAATQGWHCYSEVPGVVNFLARLRIDSPLRLIR